MVADATGKSMSEGSHRYHWLTASLLFALMLGGGAAALWYLAQPTSQPFRVVEIDGELRHVPRDALERTVADALTGGFFSADLDGVRRALLALPWVAEVRARRAWPDRLELEVREETAIAYWGEHGLVTPEGRVLYPQKETLPKGLPRLAGPEERNAPDVLARYRELGDALRPFDLEIAALHLDRRGGWSLRLDSGLELALGKAQVVARLNRFLRLYAQLLAMGIPEQADLRYSNGFAIRWRVPPDADRATDLSG